MMRCFLPVLALCATVALPALAAPLSPVKTAELSARLFDAGEAAQDAVLVLAATRLRKQISPEQMDRTSEGGAAGQGAPVGWQDMLARAEAFAAGDEMLLALIEDARAETTKGVATGPFYMIGKQGGGRADRYDPMDFRGGEYAEVYVEARSRVDLNLTVMDAQDRQVCADSDVSHIAYCGWRPSDSGSYVLVVENKGVDTTTYALMTN